MRRFAFAVLLIGSACGDRGPRAPPPLATVAPPSPSCAAGDAAACERLDRACDRDDAAACAERASLLVGDDVQRNRRAYALHVRACRLGRGGACVEAGTMARDGRGMDPNPERALALYVLGCNAGEPRGCALRKEGKLDERVAFRHARAGCEAGGAFACGALARMYEKGEGVAPDRGEAHRLHVKACRLGVDESCRALGEPEDSESLQPGP